MKNDWISTGEAASMLGVSRQHVVDLCDRGELPCTRIGTHRRIERADIQRMLAPELTREQEKSLWLHRALLGPLMQDPLGILRLAQVNLERWLPQHRVDSMAARYLEQWNATLEGGIDSVAQVLTGTDPRSIELRQNSPFAGALTDVERRQVLRSFREHWDREHAAA